MPAAPATRSPGLSLALAGDAVTLSRRQLRLCRVAFDTPGWPRAPSLIAPLNLRSVRLAERLGERFERSLVKNCSRFLQAVF
jgi:hypothetical protein